MAAIAKARMMIKPANTFGFIQILIGPSTFDIKRILISANLYQIFFQIGAISKL